MHCGEESHNFNECSGYMISTHLILAYSLKYHSFSLHKEWNETFETVPLQSLKPGELLHKSDESSCVPHVCNSSQIHLKASLNSHRLGCVFSSVLIISTNGFRREKVFVHSTRFVLLIFSPNAASSLKKMDRNINCRLSRREHHLGLFH